MGSSGGPYCAHLLPSHVVSPLKRCLVSLAHLIMVRILLAIANPRQWSETLTQVIQCYNLVHVASRNSWMIGCANLVSRTRRRTRLETIGVVTTYLATFSMTSRPSSLRARFWHLAYSLYRHLGRFLDIILHGTGTSLTLYTAIGLHSWTY